MIPDLQVGRAAVPRTLQTATNNFIFEVFHVSFDHKPGFSGGLLGNWRFCLKTEH
jgi:hypothetical protein